MRRVDPEIGAESDACGGGDRGCGRWEYSGRIHDSLGRALYAKNDFAAAVREYEQTLRLDPSYAPARENLAAALAKGGRADRAERKLETMQQVAPPDARLTYDLGVTLARLGDAAGAQLQHEEALRFDPTAEATQIRLGNLLAQPRGAARRSDRFGP